MSTSPSDADGRYRCVVCRAEAHVLHDFGMQPLTNRLPAEPDGATPAHRMLLAECVECGLVQAPTPPPPETLRPPKTMLYREPEGHLDDLVSQVLDSAAATQASRLLGLTYKDASTLDRFEARGCQHVRVFDAAADLGVHQPHAGLETIQAAVQGELVAELRGKYGAAELLIARHILEHAHRTDQFLQALAGLLSPDGRLIVEVPDCTTPLGQRDYTMMWEDHIAYFTPQTLRGSLARCGFAIDALHVYPYSQENSLVAIARGGGEDAAPAGAHAEPVDPLVRRYAASIPRVQQQWRAELSRLREARGPVALFGAGHRAISFLNLLGLAELVDLVVDEDADKQQRYLPGTRLRIEAPTALQAQAAGACLLAVSSEFEDRVASRCRDLLPGNARLFSIFPNSPYALPISLDEDEA